MASSKNAKSSGKKTSVIERNFAKPSAKTTSATTTTKKGPSFLTSFDPVDRPEHYADGEIETIDFIADKLDNRQFVGYCIGNVIKYVSRFEKKGNPVEDLRKAAVYLKWAIEAEQKVVSEGGDD